MPHARRPLRAIAAVLLCGLAGCAAPRGTAFDPVVTDPPAVPAHPASMGGVAFVSDGARLNGRIYEAAGAGPHPTLLMLHGFPGSELNLDLAQAVRRAGWNVVTFHYRGTWGSGGRFGLGHVLEDAAAVLAAIRAPAFAAAHRIDPARVALFGHSMGGFAALMTAARHPEARCTVALAAADFGALAAPAGRDPAYRAAIAATFQSWGEGPIAAMSGEALVAELLGDVQAFDLRARLPALVDRPLLLVAGARDEVTPVATQHEPQLAALRAAGAPLLEERRLDDDHAFSGSRIALARILVDFLQQRCLAGPAAGSP